MPWTEINGVRTFVAADATEHATAAPPAAAVKGASWFARHKVMTGIGAAVVAFGVIGAVVPSDPATPSTPSSATQPVAQTPTAPVVEAPSEYEPEAQVVAPEPEPEPEPAKPSMTRAQENAVSKAESYLDMTAFSRKGLIDQLKFEGYSSADATYGVDHVTVSWNEQAEKKAENYLDLTAFSRSGLIDQLVFDGFTAAQARHGVAKAGL